jgi:hypothetical protein
MISFTMPFNETNNLTVLLCQKEQKQPHCVCNTNVMADFVVIKVGIVQERMQDGMSVTM